MFSEKTQIDQILSWVSGFELLPNRISEYLTAGLLIFVLLFSQSDSCFPAPGWGRLDFCFVFSFVKTKFNLRRHPPVDVWEMDLAVCNRQSYHVQGMLLRLLRPGRRK